MGVVPVFKATGQPAEPCAANIRAVLGPESEGARCHQRKR